jgi:hypothetical protein
VPHTVRSFFAGLKKRQDIGVQVLEHVRQVGPNKEGASGFYTVYHIAGWRPAERFRVRRGRVAGPGPRFSTRTGLTCASRHGGADLAGPAEGRLSFNQDAWIRRESGRCRSISHRPHLGQCMAS